MAESTEPACPGCGKALDPRSAACASCGCLTNAVAEKQSGLGPFGQFLAAVGGGIAGLIGGSLYAIALLTVLSHYSPGHVATEFGPQLTTTWSVAAIFTICIVVPLGSCYFIGLRLARSGWPVEGTLLLTFAIGATFPTAACDVGILQSAH